MGLQCPAALEASLPSSPPSLQAPRSRMLSPTSGPPPSGLHYRSVQRAYSSLRLTPASSSVSMPMSAQSSRGRLSMASDTGRGGWGGWAPSTASPPPLPLPPPRLLTGADDLHDAGAARRPRAPVLVQRGDCGGALLRRHERGRVRSLEAGEARLKRRHLRPGLRQSRRELSGRHGRAQRSDLATGASVGVGTRESEA